VCARACVNRCVWGSEFVLEWEGEPSCTSTAMVEPWARDESIMKSATCESRVQESKRIGWEVSTMPWCRWPPVTTSRVWYNWEWFGNKLLFFSMRQSWAMGTYRRSGRAHTRNMLFSTFVVFRYLCGYLTLQIPTDRACPIWRIICFCEIHTRTTHTHTHTHKRARTHAHTHTH
jgi:hypothetical protein